MTDTNAKPLTDEELERLRKFVGGPATEWRGSELEYRQRLLATIDALKAELARMSEQRDLEHREVCQLRLELSAVTKERDALHSALKAWIDHLDGPIDAATNTHSHEKTLMKNARAALREREKGG